MMAGLLRDVGELVHEQAPAAHGSGGVAVAIEDDVLADGVGLGVNGACRGGGGFSGVDADVAQVAAEALFHGVADGGVKGFAGSGEGLVDLRGRAGIGSGGNAVRGM